ncbi:MAG TPA: ATP-grasp domain-containing protein, partial [Micromonosporaceae bacterium]
EISVEGYVHAGRAVVLTLTHKLLGAEPSFVETGHIVEYPAPQAQRATIEAYVTDLCRALGVALGPFHCELRLVDGAPVLVELGARLPGGRITDLIEIVTGVSLHRVMLATHLGLAPDAFGTAALPQAGCAGIHNLTAPDIERVTSIRGVHEVRRLPYVRDVVLDVAPGSPVPPYGDWRSRLGQVMFVADDYSEAIQRRERIEAMVQIV